MAMCERKRAEAESGRGRSWNAVKVRQNISQTHREIWNEVLLVTVSTSSHVPEPYTCTWLSHEVCVMLSCEGCAWLGITLLLKPTLKDWHLLAIHWAHSPVLLGTGIWVLHLHVWSDKTAAWGRDCCPLCLIELFSCKQRKQPHYRLRSQTAYVQISPLLLASFVILGQVT